MCELALFAYTLLNELGDPEVEEVRSTTAGGTHAAWIDLWGIRDAIGNIGTARAECAAETPFVQLGAQGYLPVVVTRKIDALPNPQGSSRLQCSRASLARSSMVR